MGNIGDMDIELIVPVIKPLDRYGIIEVLKDISPYVTISESTLYPILKRLESGGQLTVKSVEHNGRLRKYYSITPSGRERIAAFLSEWEELMRTYTYIKGGSAL